MSKLRQRLQCVLGTEMGRAVLGEPCQAAPQDMHGFQQTEETEQLICQRLGRGKCRRAPHSSEKEGGSSCPSHQRFPHSSHLGFAQGRQGAIQGHCHPTSGALSLALDSSAKLWAQSQKSFGERAAETKAGARPGDRVAGGGWGGKESR